KKLLSFLIKLINHLNQINPSLSSRDGRRMLDIINIYSQQHEKAYGKNEEPIKDRIVSLSKPYIRPIVRGKETKRVEFGAKVNKVQVNGISFIEHFSYDAFNEGTHFESGIHVHIKLFVKCTHHSADAIYATN